MLDSWRFTGRSRREGPAAAKAGQYGWLIGCWPILAVCLFGISSAAGQDFEYSLGTDDILRVTVFSHEDLSGEFEVDSSGRIALPLIGDLLVVNRSLSEVEDLIVTRLQPNYLKNPQVNIEIINYRPFYIIGEIATPGSYPYVGGMWNINAVAMASGFAYRVIEDNLLMTRAKSDEKQQSASKEIPVYPGHIS